MLYTHNDIAITPKLRYTGDEGCKIYVDAMREIYVMAVLNLKIARDKCPPPSEDPNKTVVK